MARAWNYIGKAQHSMRGYRFHLPFPHTGRGRYWEPNPERQKKAEQKRERRRQRNLVQAFRQDKETTRV